MDFWSDAQLASIDRMLNPRSIAVVGATPRMQYGGRFLAAAMGSMERGVNVYPVNPRYEEVQGLQAYPSVSALPEAPDVVGVVVPYHAVLDTLRESHEKGAKSAIVISAGFAERGVDDRRDLQGELGRFAQESGLRGSGPNCLGLANLKRRHLGERVIAGRGGTERAGWAGLPERRVGVRAVFEPGGGRGHRVHVHRVHGERGRPGLL